MFNNVLTTYRNKGGIGTTEQRLLTATTQLLCRNEKRRLLQVLQWAYSFSKSAKVALNVQ